MIQVVKNILRFHYTRHFYKLEEAIEEMKKTGKFVNEQQMQNQKLQLWALYKQATQGDVKQAQYKDNDDQGPNVSQSRDEMNKFQVWRKYKGKSKEQAQQEYIQAVKQLLQRHGYDKKIDF